LSGDFLRNWCSSSSTFIRCTKIPCVEYQFYFDTNKIRDEIFCIYTDARPVARVLRDCGKSKNLSNFPFFVFHDERQVNDGFDENWFYYRKFYMYTMYFYASICIFWDKKILKNLKALGQVCRPNEFVYLMIGSSLKT